MVTIKTNHGDIQLELNSEKAPQTVENFLTYAKESFFNGTVFHRVIDGFMVQGGGFDTDMNQKTTHDPIKNEADNGLLNELGTVAMARTNDPHSATAQFFINVANNDFLNFRDQSTSGWGYCVFGKIVNGLDVIQKIAKVQVTTHFPHQDVPVEPVIIEEVVIEEE